MLNSFYTKILGFHFQVFGITPDVSFFLTRPVYRHEIQEKMQELRQTLAPQDGELVPKSKQLDLNKNFCETCDNIFRPGKRFTYRTKFRQTNFFGGQNVQHLLKISAVLSGKDFSSVSYFSTHLTRIIYVLHLMLY